MLPELDHIVGAVRRLEVPRRLRRLRAVVHGVTNLEFAALKDAADRPGGWALFRRKTTERLAAHGWFERATHPTYGEQWKITSVGFAEYVDEKQRRALF